MDLLQEIEQGPSSLVNLDVTTLMLAYRNEVNCPEILPYQAVVDKVLQQLLDQKVALSDKTLTVIYHTLGDHRE